MSFPWQADGPNRHSFPENDLQYRSLYDMLAAGVTASGNTYALPHSDVTVAMELLKKAKEKTANCAEFDERLDMYAEASAHGSVEGLYFWGKEWLLKGGWDL
jgi:hypothetical protein